MKPEKNDLLMDVIQARRQEITAYSKLSDAVTVFEEKWEDKGVNFSAYVNYKTKKNMVIRFDKDNLPKLDVFNEIIEEFKEEFNVEVTEIHEEKYLKTSSRTFEWASLKYIFQHVDRFKDMSNEKPKKMKGDE